ncbi:hypothetical protein FZ983_15945 [Azospirillum sp. B21]|uniref:hypothetical protein n=1 Tax=Azospirillum sp. B21 TaxID=2607496 RepID=UPI0011EE1F2C|nr:hypothetical protein [Azospirillum sp. B21]KAA0578838.1 hypothetical protein FZ983_15945 [Azospirillum sp. B21]
MLIEQEIIFMKWPQEAAGNPNLVRQGTVIKNISTGQIEHHLSEAFRFRAPNIGLFSSISGALNLGVSAITFAYMSGQFRALNKRFSRLESKIDKVNNKIDELIGAVAQIDKKVDSIAYDLSSLSGRIDARHRDMVFAEVGAVLDTLAYADRKDEAGAQSIVTQNLVPIHKAIRIFDSLVDEYENALDEHEFCTVEVNRMRLMSELLSIKIDLTIGEKEAAHQKAVEISKLIEKSASDFFSRILTSSVIAKEIRRDRGLLSHISELYEEATGNSKSEFLIDTIQSSAIEYDINIAKISSAITTSVMLPLASLNSKIFLSQVGKNKIDLDYIATSITEISEGSEGLNDLLARDATNLSLNAQDIDGITAYIKELASLTSIARGAQIETQLLLSAPDISSTLKENVKLPFQTEYVLQVV